jgi:hypothetical protein
VTPRFGRRVRLRPDGVAARILALIVLLAVLAACGARPFEPTGPCTADGRAPGAYPSLEALLPTAFRDRPPDRIDSGRNCSATSLGALAANGVAELRFAGATWDLGSSSGVTLAVFEADELRAEWVARFYEAGARAGKQIETVEVRSVVLPGDRQASRIDTLNGESYQSILVWPEGERVRVALIASFVREVDTKAAHEAVVTDALAAALAE